MAENSIGSNVFRNLYIRLEDGSEVDALKDGDLSCAVFVSGILSAIGLVDKGHATVTSTIKALEEAGWQEVAISSPLPADVIVWDEYTHDDGSATKHIGFYIGNDMAISNSSEKRSPQKHHWTYEGKRSPIKLLRYNF